MRNRKTSEAGTSRLNAGRAKEAVIKKLDEPLHIPGVNGTQTIQETKSISKSNLLTETRLGDTGREGCSEEMLRERIKAIKKSYESIKAEFCNYISAFKKSFICDDFELQENNPG